MSSQYTNRVLTELAVPRELLVEGVALSALVEFLKQTTGILLITMILVILLRTVQRTVVTTEVQCQFQTLCPAHLLVVRTEGHISTDTSIVRGIVVLVVRQVTQWVEVSCRGAAILTIVRQEVTVGIEHVITSQILLIELIDRSHELRGIPGVRSCCSTGLVLLHVVTHRVRHRCAQSCLEPISYLRIHIHTGVVTLEAGVYEDTLLIDVTQ